jgi:hypothetical protein
LRWPRDILYPQNLALTSPTFGGHSVGRYRSLEDSDHGVSTYFVLHNRSSIQSLEAHRLGTAGIVFWENTTCRKLCMFPFPDERVVGTCYVS